MSGDRKRNEGSQFEPADTDEAVMEAGEANEPAGPTEVGEPLYSLTVAAVRSLK